jgi:hypothetical protein
LLEIVYMDLGLHLNIAIEERFGLKN